MNVLSVFILTIIAQSVAASKLIKPTKLENGNNYCNASDPRIAFYFNYFGLLSRTKDHIIKFRDENVHFRIQFCRPLVEPCNGKQGYSICLHKSNGKEIGVGKDPPKVDVKSGRVAITYVGDRCDDTKNYTVIFEMKCDFTMEEGIFVEMKSFHDPQECRFSMALETAKACISKQTRCRVEHKSGRYNLKPLMDLDKNYEIDINGNQTVILNVCHSLVFGEHYSICSSDSAICLMDRTNRTNLKFRSLGDLENARPKFNKTLMIEFMHGSPCDEDGQVNATRELRSTITFICDLNVTDLSSPEYIGGAEDCHYRFIWRTSVACSEQLLRDTATAKSGGNCKVTNPVTGIEYDLSIIANKTMKSRQLQGDYEISICGPLRNSTCKPGSGVCRTIHGRKKGISGGIGNANLMWKEAGPYLNYTAGDVCPDESKLYTIIDFLCGYENSLDIDEKACRTEMVFTTPIACKRACAVPNNEINFERLIDDLRDYVVTINGSNYLMYSCRSLIPDEFTNCLFGAGICTRSADSKSTMPEVVLGYPDVHPLISDGVVIITYQNGSTCQDDKTRRISSQITFICDHKIHEGIPIFTHYNNCTYYFEWKTQVSCGKVEAVLNNCSLTNYFGDYWNLSALRGSSVHQLKIGLKDEIFNISICGGKEFCNDSLVCNENYSYGNKVDIISDYADDLIQFQFSNGSKCSDGSHAQSILNVRCDEFTNIGQPILVWEEECSLEFEWRTNAVCKAPSLTDNANKLSTDNLLKKKEAEPAVVIFCLMFVCLLTMSLAWYLSDSYRRSQLLRCAYSYVLRYNIGWLPFREEPMVELNL